MQPLRRPRDVLALGHSEENTQLFEGHPAHQSIDILE
jgi:hypothetical protein